MNICVKLYTILGKQDEFESKLRELISKIREQLKARGIEPERVNLVVVKVRDEFVNEAIKYIREGGQVPDYLKGLVELMLRDGVSNIPALLINSRKVSEGSLPDLNEVEDLLYREVKLQFNIDLKSETEKGKTAERVERTVEETEKTETEKAEGALIEELSELETEISREEKEALPEEKKAEFKPAKHEAEELIDMAGETVEISSRAVVTEKRESLTKIERVSERTEEKEVLIREEGRPVELMHDLTLREPSSCRDCIFYGRNTGYCFMLSVYVENPDEPPCRQGKTTSGESL